ncbi:MAG: cob(I)yrinic acid a,c-diamide adenosyltransferase [Candidatus Dormibacteria bacterium]
MTEPPAGSRRVISIATRRGDGGETSLLYGGRVAKDDPHAEACGAVDEAVSALGVARAQEADHERAERLLALQRDLFTVGAELATGPGERAQLERHFATITAAMVERLDAQLADLEARVPLPRGFVVPGGTPVAAAIDLARTLVRRAERRAVSLRRTGLLENPEVLRYLNRLSDLLFMLAREAEQGATVLRHPSDASDA